MGEGLWTLAGVTWQGGGRGVTLPRPLASRSGLVEQTTFINIGWLSAPDNIPYGQMVLQTGSTVTFLLLSPLSSYLQIKGSYPATLRLNFPARHQLRINILTAWIHCGITPLSYSTPSILAVIFDPSPLLPPSMIILCNCWPPLLLMSLR